MKINAFLDELQDLLQREEPVTSEMALKNMEEWDSLSAMAIIAWFDKKFNIRLTFLDFENLYTVMDIIALGQGNIR